MMLSEGISAAVGDFAFQYYGSVENKSKHFLLRIPPHLGSWIRWVTGWSVDRFIKAGRIWGCRMSMSDRE